MDSDSKFLSWVSDPIPNWYPLPAFASSESFEQAAKGIEDSLVRHMKRMRKGI